jgi:beta-glucosidase
VALNLYQVEPASERPEDIAAAGHVDLIANRVFLDPMFADGYSEELRTSTAGLTDWSFVRPEDEAEIRVALDSVGINFYNPAVSAGEPPPDTAASRAPIEPSSSRSPGPARSWDGRSCPRG